jgi:hypothetical protein
MILTIILSIVGLAIAAAGGLYALHQTERWMAFMDRLYNPPGQRPFPVRRG